MDHETTLEGSPESLVRLQTARRAIAILLGIPDNHITQIDVFGSTANGKATKISDIDVCIRIGNEISDREALFIGGTFNQELQKHGLQTGAHTPMALDLTIMKDMYFENPTKLPNNMQKYIDDIKREGITIYKKQQ